jgi:hypothetical protein
MRLFQNGAQNRSILPRPTHSIYLLNLYHYHHESNYKMDSFDVFGDIDITDIVPIIALGAVQEAQSKVPRSTGLPGAAYSRTSL